MRNVLYFLNGSIGDFLMALFLMENIHMSPNGGDTRLFVVTPRNKKLFQALARAYPYVNLIEASRSTPYGLAVLARFIFTKNIVMLPPTPGTLPLRAKIIAKLLALMPESTTLGFIGKKGEKEGWFDHGLVFDTSVPYHATMIALAREAGFSAVKEKPTFTHKKDTAVLARYQLTEKNYTVIHPCAATEGRGMYDEELARLILAVSEKSGLPVMVTGGTNDRERIGGILNGHAFPNAVHNCAGELSVDDLVNVLAGARWYIGVDTGITHLASFLRVPTLVIAHHGTPHWLPFYNENAHILYTVDGCAHNINEGKGHLEECRTGRVRPLLRVPEGVYMGAVDEFYGSSI
ncbi:MAG: hypothetical protein A2675_01395 [Candidatus Yonathbacteria bacterium RIFCSPHIGHO2_01_FULL_51_10]|uniref:Glycosyl transferase family 9 n=1 Tax=Candidatus Yonathbacteria bacterium RIFCSPHIGHO2_01_FULL_51_10 TaxID=1802723 RepID=A0A1G2S446_9BACT|nr:MAG: hypothetical protein A2675_01395 [Candidatus Yonathbacteria bacterium RIFCSPHIGHO2_01_FULL_51_10]